MIKGLLCMLASVLGVCQKNNLGANVLGDPNEGAHEKTT